METQHEEQVENDVHEAGEYQEHERQHGVSHRSQNSAAHVVDEEPGDAGEIDSQVKRRVVKNVLRRRHQMKHGLHIRHADDGVQHTEAEGQRHGGLDRRVKLIFLLRAEPLPDHNAGAYGETVEEKHQHIDDHGGGAYRRQCLRTDKIAHHNGVHRVVHHLEDVAEQEWKRKQQKLL